MLCQTPFQELPELYNSLLAKLRLGGRLVIYFTDFDLVNMQYDKGMLGIKEVGEILFKRNSQSVLNEHVIRTLIGDSLQIEKRDYNGNYQGIVVGVRK